MRRIRLTESHLNRVIAESVRRVIKEGDSQARKERLIHQGVLNHDLTPVQDDVDGTVYLCNTFKGMRLVGSGTKWCPVARQEYFDSYDPLYVCVAADGSRYLYSPQGNGVVNEEDIFVEDYPSVLDNFIQQTKYRYNSEPSNLPESLRRYGRRINEVRIKKDDGTEMDAHGNDSESWRQMALKRKKEADKCQHELDNYNYGCGWINGPLWINKSKEKHQRAMDRDVDNGIACYVHDPKNNVAKSHKDAHPLRKEGCSGGNCKGKEAKNESFSRRSRRLY